MSKKPDVEIIKIPTERPISRPKKFPRMPIMYLELLENKDKVKPELANKEYVPTESVEKSPVEKSPETRETSAPAETVEKSVSESARTKKSSEPSSRDSSTSSRRSSSKRSSSKRSSSRRSSSRRSSTSSTKSSKCSKKSSESSEDDVLRNRIRAMMKDTPSQSSSKSLKKKPPTLAELENKHKKHQNFTYNDENDENLKRELLFKFELLKKSYKSIDIPEFTLHSDYQTMLRTYESTLKRVTIDSNVEQYKTYFTGGCMLLEWVLGTMFKLDMQGFTQQQIVNMASYERLLIELGEKSYVPIENQWPVEVRLLTLILINAAVFIGTKYAMKKLGGNITNMMNAFNVGTNMRSGPPPPQSVPQPAKKMKGPTINLDDIPDS